MRECREKKSSSTLQMVTGYEGPQKSAQNCKLTNTTLSFLICIYLLRAARTRVLQSLPIALRL